MGKPAAGCLVMILLGLLLGARAPNSKATADETPVTKADEQAVVQAIEDEIYDWGCQSYVEFVGKETAHGARQIRAYINPKIESGRGEIIYKFMPIGEIYRSFWIGKSGLARLGDSPSLGFGPERPDYNTLYMDDDVLCKDKQDWLKSYFVIRFHPSQERLQEAVRRQKQRLAQSYTAHGRDCPLRPR